MAKVTNLEEARTVNAEMNKKVSERREVRKALAYFNKIINDTPDEMIEQFTKAGIKEEQAVKAVWSYQQNEIGDNWYALEIRLKEIEYVINSEIATLPRIPLDLYTQLRGAA